MDNDIAILSPAKRKLLKLVVTSDRAGLGDLALLSKRTTNSVQNDLLDMVDQGLVDFEYGMGSPGFKKKGKTYGGRQWYVTVDGRQVLEILERSFPKNWTRTPYSVVVVWVRPLSEMP